ncbi:hypothetical protein PHYSODRAFT_312692 [Phytophthora sojae]|uniref:Uncharacterized protein n=1 Tax=Phytophthora sojae (strain P6497) TaxID=1094619 RepID=G4Z6K2_PHYSP|nr:hypothetical protein PHYSODRAFT_312692 [Phytophthora sojae]EGZ19572.1 hypothetical protein PHYSODRAFT_312692 [Phytophthora sojae]|eukprot:XP_009522289.1 hypothetical protein PHYSODRAFT_312692 [Phytophthora sojae]
MDFIYCRLGVPVKPRQLMIDLLGPGTIEVRSAFGWIDTGEREFGLGQGSILSILHIGCYMDLLQTQLEKGEDPVKIKHHQHGGGIDIASTLFVDDQLDISTSYCGIQSRADVTNIFTGANATGGVFGAAKSFMMYLNTGKDHYPAIRINDGLGVPRPVQVVTPAEGFKHLGVYQGGESQWAASISPTWAKLLRYRMILSDATHLAANMDVFIRQAARNVLRLPYTTPRRVFYDAMNGLGLINCEQDTSIERFNAALRILNDSELRVHHVLVEQLERYQERAGLTENPLVQPVRPPNHVRTWTASLMKYAAGMNPPLQLSIVWTSPPATMSKRGNDRCLEHLQR